MKPARILLLVIAIAAGGLAAYFATRGEPPAPEQIVTSVEAPSAKVLVATRTIGIGERLGPEDTAWQNWPESGVQPQYTTDSELPDAPEQLVGTVARFEIFRGEPILEAKLVRSNQGYLSAVISKGMRGVSVPVRADSASGGFVVPNDRVDVVLTRGTPNGEVSETILANVRVMAIGARLGEAGATGTVDDEEDPETPRSRRFAETTIATLELDPRQAEVIINARSIGTLSLVLRSVVDFGEPTELNRANGSGAAIRLIRYGVEQAIQADTRAEQQTTPQASQDEAVAPQVFNPASPPASGAPGGNSGDVPPPPPPPSSAGNETPPSPALQ